jgi:hypothetical protein
MANVIKHKRGSGSDPGASDLVVGEVAIRTDVGKLFTKMDNGSVAEIAGGGSDIAINTLSSSSATGGGSATFNGSAYRFTLSQPPSVSAQQLLVSINGVIQKPVAGTGQPSEGFSVDGNDIILGDAPATGADFFILTFKSLGVSEPADNSVTSAKIADGAIVNADINASAAIAGSKIDPTFTSAISTSANEITISGGTPKLNLTDTGNNPDYVVANNDGQFRIRDATNSANRLTISSDGTVNINGNLDVAAGIDVTGAITSTGGVQITGGSLDINEKIKHIGDLDTFISFPSNDTIGLTTGNTERMRIDSSGRVAINTAIGANEGDEHGGFVSMKPTHNFDNNANNLATSATQSTLRVRTSSNSSMSLYIGGLGNSVDSARPYLQVGNLSGASGATAFYDLYLCPFGGIVRTKQIIPKEDNQHDLGSSANRWDDVFATNGTINTSDRNEKNTIVDSDLGLSFINKLKPVSYKFNGKTRTHYGLIAQDIETVLSDISKSTTDFAGFIKGEVSDVLYTEDDPLPTGKNVGDVKIQGTTNYGLRYAEFIAPLIKAVQELTAKVEALEAG